MINVYLSGEMIIIGVFDNIIFSMVCIIDEVFCFIIIIRNIKVSIRD